MSLSRAMTDQPTQDNVPSPGPEPAVGVQAPTNSRIRKPLSPKGALLWSLVCPGVGEYRVGYRRTGLLLALVFVAACSWLLVASYGAMFVLSDTVKSQDPSLAAHPLDAGHAAGLAVRLAVAIHREYLRQRDEIHSKISGPLLSVFVLYVYSMVQAYVLAGWALKRARENPE